MDGKQALYYVAIALAVLIALSVVGTVVSVVLGVTFWVLTWALRLAVLAGLGYVVYKAGSWLLGGDDSGSFDPVSSGSSSVDAGTSQQDRLRQQYVEGQISEAEFERRIGEELETEELDGIDRELERER